jgi:hypothetical protein
VWNSLDKGTIAGFLRNFRVQPNWNQRLFEGTAMADFVAGAVADDLQKWDLVVVGGDGERNPNFDFIEDEGWRPPSRSFGGSPDEGWTVSGRRMRVLGPGDVATTLTDSVRDEAEAGFRAIPENSTKKSVPDRVYTRALDRPVLFVYPIQAKAISGKVAGTGFPDPDLPQIAIAVVVPGERDQQQQDNVTYLFNAPAQRLWDPTFIDDLIDEEEDEEDGDERN